MFGSGIAGFFFNKKNFLNFKLILNKIGQQHYGNHAKFDGLEGNNEGGVGKHTDSK
jgi:hypothetical protein